jgi:hypothetical protein
MVKTSTRVHGLIEMEKSHGRQVDNTYPCVCEATTMSGYSAHKHAEGISASSLNVEIPLRSIRQPSESTQWAIVRAYVSLELLSFMRARIRNDTGSGGILLFCMAL